MADERVVDEIVTKFLLYTTRLRPWPSKRAVQAAVLCAVGAGMPQNHDVDAVLVPLITGSMAEFYIEPMLPHVGDVDIMGHANTMLAIPRGHPVPTQLPAEYQDYVKVFEVIDSQQSGYVYLEPRYLLTKCSDSCRYNATVYEERGVCVSMIYPRFVYCQRHGPAYQFAGRNEHLPYDLVRCFRCLSWPPQAASWPSRRRLFGCPDSETVGRVVNNGCDVVAVPHRQYRHDGRISERQCRLSFSRAEIELLNSWMPVQQLVYHLLRVFMKSEQLTESANNSGVSSLSNYHIKTLMLWACELKPKCWRTDDLSLIRICVELLHDMADWLTEARFPHYFIDNCNLVDKSDALEMTTNRLSMIDKSCFSSWLLTDYIRQSVQICPESVSRLFDDLSSSRPIELENAVSTAIGWRQNRTTSDMLEAFQYAEYNIPAVVCDFSVSAASCVCWMAELSKIDARLSVYFIAVLFLHAAHKIGTGGLIKGLTEAVAVAVTQFLGSGASNYYSKRMLHSLTKIGIFCRECQTQATNVTECSIHELVELMQQTAVHLLTDFRHFEAREFGSVASIATTDFEALYAYKRGDYRRCLQLSTQIVHMLLYAKRVHEIPTFPMFIQLMDDEIASLTALTMIINPECRRNNFCCVITQLTMSLYLMSQCASKLHHSVTTLAVLLDCTEVAQKRHDKQWMLDALTLKLTERKLMAGMHRLVQLKTICRQRVCSVTITPQAVVWDQRLQPTYQM